jgi:hypothetical protein
MESGSSSLVKLRVLHAVGYWPCGVGLCAVWDPRYSAACCRCGCVYCVLFRRLVLPKICDVVSVCVCTVGQ